MYAATIGERTNALLGQAARRARSVNLARPLGAVREGADAVFVRLGRPPLSATAHGVRLRGYLRHRSFLVSIARGGYEASLDALFEAALTDDAVVVDAGAHIGLYSLLAAPRVSGGAVLAFEPDAYNAAALRFNVRAARAKNIEVLDRALADVDGEAVFHASVSTIGSSLVDRSDIPTRPPVNVRTARLDTVLDGRSLDRLVVKFDLEGAEPVALRGAERSIRRARSVAMFVEIHPEVLARAGSSGRALVDALRALDLDVAYVDRAGTIAPITDADALAKGNLYAWRGL